MTSKPSRALQSRYVGTLLGINATKSNTSERIANQGDLVGTAPFPRWLIYLRLVRRTIFRVVRRWERKPLVVRKRQVLLVFGLLIGLGIVRFVYSWYYSFQAVAIKSTPKKELIAVPLTTCRKQISQFLNYFFNLSPTPQAIASGLDSAQVIGDSSVMAIRNSLTNAGYYNALLAAGIRQELMLNTEHIDVDMSKNPAEFRANGQLMLFAQHSLTIRNLVVKGTLVQTPYKVYPMPKYEIRHFVVLDNSHYQTYSYGTDSSFIPIDSVVKPNLDSPIDTLKKPLHPPPISQPDFQNNLRTQS